MQIKAFILLLYCTTASTLVARSSYTIMLDPAGDAKHTGRLIGDHFERGLTLQCAQYIKATLEDTFNNIEVLMTRFPGQTIAPLQNATFANHMADLYISLHCCSQPTSHNSVSFYYYCADPTALAKKQSKKITFIPVEQVHQQATALSQNYAHAMYHACNPQENASYTAHAPLGILFLPLKGILCPSFALELALKNPQDISFFAQVVVNGIATLIDDLQRKERTHE